MKDPRPSRSKKKQKAKTKSKKAVGSPAVELPNAPGAKSTIPAVWRPGQDSLEEGETLDFDPTAYTCLHALTLDYPCLSFDVLRDALGAPRHTFPHSLLFAAATQADVARANYMAYVGLNNLQQMKTAKKDPEDSGDDDLSDSEEEDNGGPPVLHARMLALGCGANRVRAMPQKPGIVAVFLESGVVEVIDGTTQLEELAAVSAKSSIRSKPPKVAPLKSHKHAAEGFAVDWSRTVSGRLATGDNSAQIHIWEPSSSGASMAVSSPYKGHESSVEDIQWSPAEETVFASCSADKTVRIWDTRECARSMLSVAAHDADVNVIAWNADTDYMLASGGDEGALKVWDLRSFAEGRPVASFSHHRAAITSVEWCPTEASMLATTGADGQLCVWDLALERDPEEEMVLANGSNATAPEDLPPQLLFVHGGQTDLKEVHWHPQIPGMLLSTAADGFNVFKPSNVA